MPSHKPLKMKIKLPTRVQPEVVPPPGETGLYTNKIHYLRKYLLDELISKKFAMDFMEPVDTAALQVPNYYTIIRRPMDVGTIIKRVQNRYYHRVDELILDFRLVISNCFTFNRPGDVVYRNCQKLERFFYRVLNKMPRGEEKVSTKDPRAPGKQSFEKTSEAVQRQCREQIRKLQMSIAREEDKSICKTVEEYRFELDYIFKKFDIEVKLLYYFFHRVCENGSFPLYENCLMSKEQEITKYSESRYNLLDKDITEVLYTLKRAESGVDHCQKSYTSEKEERARNLIEVFVDAANRLQLKLKNEYQGTSEMSEEENDVGNSDNQETENTYSYAQQSSDEEEYEPEDYEVNTIPQVEQEGYNMQIGDSYSQSPDWKKARIDCTNDLNDSTTSSEAEVEAEDETESEAEIESDVEADADVQTEAEVETEANADADAETEDAPNNSMLWADLELTSSEESNGSELE
ncbi:bromodomain testis-specific protein-like isoform X2 [Drosophila innubila]|uniref:bromodomain testis-specific protein-like isoform X2 n=1 Tax=Drosophila innubila TaxID=198719 RepID=UPI00148B3BD1|nr:bromodomain testis-specific protein-like isoform X2 [Drosophila innubila]